MSTRLSGQGSRRYSIFEEVQSKSVDNYVKLQYPCEVIPLPTDEGSDVYVRYPHSSCSAPLASCASQGLGSVQTVCRR